MEDECAVPGTTDPEHENTIPEDAVADTDDGQGFKLVVSNIKYVDARRIEKILREKGCPFRTVHKKCSTVSFATIEFDDEDAMQNAKAALVGFVIKAIQAGRLDCCVVRAEACQPDAGQNHRHPTLSRTRR